MRLVTTSRTAGSRPRALRPMGYPRQVDSCAALAETADQEGRPHDRDRTAAPEGSGLVPGWLLRLAAIGWRLLATIALGLVLIWIASLLSTVTASILVAAIVAATFAPFVLALRDRGWSRIKAAAAVFLGAGSSSSRRWS